MVHLFTDRINVYNNYSVSSNKFHSESNRTNGFSAFNHLKKKKSSQIDITKFLIKES